MAAAAAVDYGYEDVDMGYEAMDMGYEAVDMGYGDQGTTCGNNARNDTTDYGYGTTDDAGTDYGYGDDNGKAATDCRSNPANAYGYSTAGSEDRKPPTRKISRRNSTVIRKDDDNPLAIAEFLMGPPPPGTTDMAQGNALNNKNFKCWT
ncbi:hypothetical protein MPSEU_000398300 [Mayamaea pseudoterrestris]|nr:hypothetical protein MPSEU_000398300 [Mayamaea pseudoterrestris]